jgi:predicted DNA binding protein
LLEDLLAAIRASRLTDWVWVIDQAHGFGNEALIPGATYCGLVVGYRERNSINGPLVEHGFIPDAPVRMYDGREYWLVIVNTDRQTARRRLEEVRAETDADIRVQHVSSARENIGPGIFWHDTLSNRQREVFLLARKRGYYHWPREVSAGELAEELGITKSTLLEHLRKAEAKLLDPEQSVSDDRRTTTASQQ